MAAAASDCARSADTDTSFSRSHLQHTHATLTIPHTAYDTTPLSVTLYIYIPTFIHISHYQHRQTLMRYSYPISATAASLAGDQPTSQQIYNSEQVCAQHPNSHISMGRLIDTTERDQSQDRLHLTTLRNKST